MNLILIYNLSVIRVYVFLKKVIITFIIYLKCSFLCYFYVYHLRIYNF